MSNTEESEQVSKLEDKLTNNEKEEIVINIAQFQTVVEPTKQPLDSGNITDQYTNGNDKNSLNEVILAIKNENLDNVDEQKPTVELVDKRKAPDVWVQYLREVKGNNNPAKQIEVGSRRGSGGRNYQHQGSGGGGFHYDPSRNSFLLLVFTILLVMLALTFLYNVVVLTSPSMTDFYRTNRRALLFLSVGVLIVMSYVMICCLPCVRITPCNYISLLIVLAATSNLTAVLTALVRTQIILFALIGTSVTVAICLLLALSKFDFTAWYLYVMVIGIVIAVLSLALGLAHVCFDIYFKPLHMALLYVATIFQVILLVMELQMVIGGRSIEIYEEDYILAAYLLYTSIVNLFLQILQIVADLSD